MIDLLASQPQYLAHLDPLWDALPPEVRGDRIDLDGGGPQFRQLRSARRPSGGSVVVASFRDMGHAWQRGYRRIALLEHGAGQSYLGLNHGSYSGGPGRGYVGLFLSPSEGAAEHDREAYPRARVEVIGDPVLDILPAFRAEPDAEPVVAVSFHWDWDRRGVPELRSAAPHYLAALPGLARRFHVIGHAHPRAMDKLAPIYRRLGIEVVTSFGEVCERASVYVVDNSSTLFEFASTGRPVVVLNAPFYRREVSHGLRFWDAANVGVQVDEPADLVAGVEEALADSPEQQEAREAALRIAYARRSGAAQVGADAIVSWIGDMRL